MASPRETGQRAAPSVTRGGVIAAPNVTRGGVIAVPHVTRGGVIAAPHVTRGGVIAAPHVTRGGVIAAPTVNRGGVIAAPTVTRGGVRSISLTPLHCHHSPVHQLVQQRLQDRDTHTKPRCGNVGWAALPLRCCIFSAPWLMSFCLYDSGLHASNRPYRAISVGSSRRLLLRLRSACLGTRRAARVT